ncbi:unnamed protein product [Cylindrotheca closterium]|uniref:Uncharacterized protein n=1 Tax=Cylindrotheca closterium TaxID=2856 RepID=A0AAD2FUE0_9STRA|nr:unnamed protein product [Cylindrotheca closterium]
MNGVFAALKHHGGEALHNWLGLDMEVAKHGVTFPASNELDGVAIDVGAEKGHGTARTKGAGANVGRKETEVGAAGGCSLVYCSGDVGRFYGVMAAVLEIGCNDGVHVCSMLSEMEDTADHGADGAEDIMSAPTVTDDFATDTILLRGECKGNTGGSP